MQPLSIEGLFITRKRKKWKFAHFDSYKNCFSHARGSDPEPVQTALASYLPANQPIVLELAAGNAQFSLQLAQKYPKTNFIAIDIKSDRLYTSAKQALEEGVANIAFVRMSINELEKVFSENSINLIWLTFPDPFMRKRSIRRRLTHRLFLEKYRKLMVFDGLLKFKTDNRDLFLWSLEQFVADNWYIKELSFDLHESDLPEDYKIKTAYEHRFIKEGLPINFLAARS